MWEPVSGNPCLSGSIRAVPRASLNLSRYYYSMGHWERGCRLSGLVIEESHMKIRLLVSGTVLVLSAAASVHCQGPGPGTSPRFENYSVSSIFHGKPAVPIFARGQGGFRTRIREGARKGPNFAGHLTIAEWGCGSGCVSFAVVDAVSGRLYPTVPFVGLEVPYQGAATGREYEGLEYRLNSSLLIADGCPEDPDSDDSSKFEKNCGTRYYKWERNQFVLIGTVSVPAKSR
jgi:hypothetical protein